MADETYDVVLKVRAEGEGDLERITREFEKLRAETAKTQSTLDSMAKSVNGWGLAAKTAIAGVVAGFAAGALESAVSGFTSAIKASWENLDRLDDAAKRVGVSANELSKLEYAAKISGIETDTLEKNITKLAKQVANLSDASSKGANALRAYGVTAGDTVTEALSKVAEQFSKMPDGIEKTNAAIQIFGKSGAELIPLLNEGSAGIAELTAEAERMGVAVSDEAAAAVNQMNDDLDRMRSQLAGVANEILQGMVPALSAIVSSFVGASSSGNSFIGVGQAIGNMLVELAAWFIRAAAQVRDFAYQLGLANQLLMSKDWDTTVKTFNQLNDSIGVMGKNAKAAEVQVAQLKRTVAQAPLKALGNQWAAGLDTPTGGGIDISGGGSKRKSGGGSKRAASIKKEVEKVAPEIARMQRESDQFLAKWERIRETTISTGDLAKTEWVVAEQASEQYIDKTLEGLNKILGIQGKLTENQQAMADAFANFAGQAITDFKHIEDAAKELLATLIKIILKQIIINAFQGNSVFSGLFAKGGAFAKGMQLFGKGGITNGPTVFPMANGGVGMMGEQGAEAVMPLGRNSKGQLGVYGAGLNVQVNNYASPDVEVRTSQRRDGGLTMDVVRRNLASDVRRGGNDLTRAMERTYRVNRGEGAY